MKVRTYGALMGALLTITSVEAAEAATPATPPACPCAPAPAKPAATVHRAPAVRQTKDDGLAYAQSYYNYRSASRVTESFVRPATAKVPPPAPVARPPLQNDGWQVAPNDAHIHFYRDEREVIMPSMAYPQSYYQQSSYPQAYYAPPSPVAYGYPEPPPGVDLGEQEQQGFNGGVGYGSAASGGGGGGGGGGITLYMNQGGGSDEPPNGGGVNVPPGYGPTYRGVFQGPVPPTRGGLSGH